MNIHPPPPISVLAPALGINLRMLYLVCVFQALCTILKGLDKRIKRFSHLLYNYLGKF